MTNHENGPNHVEDEGAKKEEKKEQRPERKKKEERKETAQASGGGSGKELRNGIAIAVVTAITTGLTTAAGSYWLVDQRLGKEHEYWLQQLDERLPKEHQYWIDKQEHLRAMRVMDAQLALVRELTQELGNLQGLRWRINERMVYFLALQMLTERHEPHYAQDLLPDEERAIDQLRTELESSYNKVQAHFFMAKMIFRKFQEAPADSNREPLAAFGAYFQSTEYVITGGTASDVKKELALLPGLRGDPNHDTVRAVAYQHFYATSWPGHEKFSALSHDLLSDLGEEIAPSDGY